MTGNDVDEVDNTYYINFVLDHSCHGSCYLMISNFTENLIKAMRRKKYKVKAIAQITLMAI